MACMLCPYDGPLDASGMCPACKRIDPCFLAPGWSYVLTKAAMPTGRTVHVMPWFQPPIWVRALPHRRVQAKAIMQQVHHLAVGDSFEVRAVRQKRWGSNLAPWYHVVARSAGGTAVVGWINSGALLGWELGLV